MAEDTVAENVGDARRAYYYEIVYLSVLSKKATYQRKFYNSGLSEKMSPFC